VPLNYHTEEIPYAATIQFTGINSPQTGWHTKYITIINDETNHMGWIMTFGFGLNSEPGWGLTDAVAVKAVDMDHVSCRRFQMLNVRFQQCHI